jgi:hypothetical protein
LFQFRPLEIQQHGAGLGEHEFVGLQVEAGDGLAACFVQPIGNANPHCDTYLNQMISEYS